MCRIIAKGNLIGKSFDSIVKAGMIFTNKRGQIKSAAVFPPERPLEWVSLYGSVTFSQCGKEFPVSGINERGLVAE
jgi:penicillin V acylase-like amidase (Ntn superfamily)